MFSQAVCIQHPRGASVTVFYGAVVSIALLLSALLLSAPALAQTVPTECKPVGNVECVAKFVEPYWYNGVAVGGGIVNPGVPVGAFATLAEAAYQAIATDFTAPHTGICTRDYTFGRWLNPGETVAGPNGSLLSPGINSDGQEVYNYALFHVSYTSGQSCATTTEGDYILAKRERYVFCPTGYQTASGGHYCAKYQSTKTDGKTQACPDKHCKPQGDPIIPGTGNQYQVETDYRGEGAFPLVLRRSYNSNLSTTGNMEGFLYPAQWLAVVNGGMNRLPHVGLSDDGIDGSYRIMAVDGLGAGWRHSYQRVLVFSDQSATGGIASVFAFRPNGRAYSFTWSSGALYAPDDVADRLQSVSGGYSYFDASTQETENYDANGKLTQIQARGGAIQTLTYDICDRLKDVSDAYGHKLTFAYSSGAPGSLNDCKSGALDSQIQSVTTPASQQIAYGHGGTAGQLTSVSYPDGTSRVYSYTRTGQPRALTGITDEAGQPFANFEYDDYGRATMAEHIGGVGRVEVAYTQWPTNPTFIGSVTVTEVNGSQSVSRTFKHGWFAGAPRMLGRVQPAASGSGTASEDYAYDVNGNLTSLADFNGNLSCFLYDLTRNLETVRAEGLTTSLGCPSNLTTYTPTPGTRQRKITTSWNSSFRLPDLITEATRTTAFTYYTSGLVNTRTVTDTSVTPNVSRSWSYTYDTSGRMLTEDGPRTDVSDVTTYSYYTCTTGTKCGQVQTITNALSQVTTFNTYNSHGQPLTFTDPNGVVTTLGYDSRQRLTSRQVGSETTTLTYWPTGLLKKVTLPDSSFLLYTYDTAHRLIKIEDGAGNRIQYTLDAMGNRTAENVYDPSSSLSRTRTQTFNSLNQLWKQIGAAGTAAVTTTFGYDDNGNQTTANAPLSRNSSQQYDELNRLKQMTDPGSGVTQFAYDANDNLTSVTDPRSKVTSYTYTGFDDLKQLVSPDTGTTVNTYDSGGNLKTSTDARSAITTYTYDALNRVSTAAFKVGSTTDQTISFTYDFGTNGAGRLTGASDSTHSLSWQYDARGRVTSKSQVQGAVTQTVSYGYTNGNQTSLTTPSGQAVAYGYSNGQITSMSINGSTLLSGVLYEPFGPARLWTWGNSTLTSRTYDTDGRISLVDSKHQYGYSYDNANRITGTTNSGATNFDWTLGYDPMDRLTSASRTGESFGWNYDANGNRTSQTSTATDTYTISGTNNRISSISGGLTRTYGYDNAGNTTGYGAVSLAYNNRGRMKSATVSGTATNYVYNALGQLIKKSGGGGTALFVYDESGHLLGEYASTGALVQETVWLGDIPVATLRPKTGGGIDVFYVHTDHLNTPRRVTRPSDNKMRWKWDPNPFTDAAVSQNPENLGTFVYNLRLPGQIHMAETGLRYNYYRDGYDPATGRYTQSDPIGLFGGINTYAYVRGNPLSFADPLGLRSLRDFCFPIGYKAPRVSSVMREDTARPGKILATTLGAADLQITGVGPSVDWTPRRGLPGIGPGVDANVGVGMHILQEWTVLKGERKKWVQEIAYWCVPNDQKNGQCLEPDEYGYEDDRVVSEWEENNVKETIERRWRYEPSGYRVNLP